MASRLSYCAQLVYDEDRDRFLSALFVPQPEREALLAIYALNIELAHVHRAVREEMIGHIRYAWWRETLEAAYSGQMREGHPVLQALAPVIGAKVDVLPLVGLYGDAFPQMPEYGDTVKALSLALIRAACPHAEQGWSRAFAVIARHRKRFAAGWNSWLALKLLLAGR